MMQTWIWFKNSLISCVGKSDLSYSKITDIVSVKLESLRCLNIEHCMLTCNDNADGSLYQPFSKCDFMNEYLPLCLVLFI